VPIRYNATCHTAVELRMSSHSLAVADRRCEAERLIALARLLLDRPAEEIVVNYLNHAIEALHLIEAAPLRSSP
jgi:hypothetical protein